MVGFNIICMYAGPDQGGPGQLYIMGPFYKQKVNPKPKAKNIGALHGL